jgi:hypothetical protein
MGCSGSETNVVHAAEASKWTMAEIPLKIYHDKPLRYASAEGFWKSTSASKEKQLAFPIAVKIACHKWDKVCNESDATVSFGALAPELIEYDISSWTADGIMADDTDEGCS